MVGGGVGCSRAGNALGKKSLGSEAQPLKRGWAALTEAALSGNLPWRVSLLPLGEEVSLTHFTIHEEKKLERGKDWFKVTQWSRP